MNSIREVPCSEGLPDVVRRVARRLAHAAELASIAAEGSEPEVGAEYLMIALEDIAADAACLRAAVAK